MSYKIDWEKNNKVGIVITYHSDVSKHDIFEVQDIIFSDPLADNLHYLICDFSCVQTFHIDDEGVDEVALLDFAASKSVRKKIKLALIRNEKSQYFSDQYMNSFNGVCNSWDVSLFDDINQAKEWIG